MSETSVAYSLAQHIHDTFWLRNGLISPRDLSLSRAYPKLSETTGVEQVVACRAGNDPSEPGLETLSKTKNGNFLFYATPGEIYTGDLSLDRHVITPNSGDELAYRLASSLLVKNLVHIANSQIHG